MEMEQVNKVVKLNENPMGNEEEFDDDGGEKCDIELSDMDKLPNEILMKILDYLDEQQLVKCRIFNSRWNEICCLLLQEKSKNNPNSKLTVQIKKDRDCTTVITEDLYEFLDLFSPCDDDGKLAGLRRPFPFSRFIIEGLDIMEKQTMARFVPLFRHIKTLFIQVGNQEAAKKTEIFWRLLLKFAPNIEHLGLSGTRWTDFELYDPYFNFKANCDFSQKFNKAQNMEDTFVNKLKVVELKLQNFEFHEELGFGLGTHQLLEQLPNVQKLICHQPIGCKRRPGAIYDGPICGEFHLLQLWQTYFERVHLLKNLELTNSVVDGAKRYAPPAYLMKNLQLENLRADCAMSSSSVKNEKSTINHIHHALKSSQETLKRLDLYNLTMESMNHCFNEISSLPNVLHLKVQIQNAMETGTILEGISQLCPNLTSLKLDRLHGDYSDMAKILWTGFKGLKFLKASVDLTSGNDNSLALDSAISGYSQAKLEGGISLDEARQNEPQNPSILDLKGLSRLELAFFMGKRTTEIQKVENQIGNSVFFKILPQHIREYPRSILYYYS